MKACAALSGALVAAAIASVSARARADGTSEAPPRPGQHQDGTSDGKAPSRVLIVRAGGADPLLDGAGLRLAAELRAAGFVVEEREAAGDEGLPQAEESATGGPFATVFLQRAHTGAATEVWVADHVTHKVVVRRLAARGRGDAAERSLALRIVELMRASLVEGLVLPPSEEDDSRDEGPVSPTPAALQAPPPDVSAWTREALHEPKPRAPSRVLLSLGAAAAYAGPDVGMALGPELRLAWRASGAWSVALVAAPVFGARVEAREGSATVTQELGLVEVAFEVLSHGPLSALLFLGAGGYHLDATGYAAPPFFSGHAEAWTGLGALGVGIRVRLAGATSLLVDARELLALPRPVVVFGTERVAEAMQPGTMAGVSLAVDL